MEETTDPRQRLPFLQERAAQRALVLFLGAGVSHDAGLPTWADLVEPLAQELALDERIEPIDVVEYYTESEEGRRAHLEQMIQRRLRTATPPNDGTRVPARPGKLHEALARIPAPVSFTTNFDQLMEDAIGEARGAPPDVIIRDADVGLIDESRGVTLVKLHGCISLPRTMVLSRSGVEAYSETHQAMIAYLQALLATRTFLFVGFSLVDPNFRLIHRAIRAAIGPGGRPAYALMQGENLTPLLQGWARRRVQPLLFPRFDDIRGYVEEIAAGSNRPPTLPALDEPLQGIRETLQSVIRHAAADVTQIGAEDEAEASLTQEETGESGPAEVEGASIRDVLDLVSAFDRISPLEPVIWQQLGDLLYRQRDAVGAIRAYHGALQQAAEDGSLDEETLLRVRGNLARALAQQGHHARAEWLLRRCVFRAGEETSAEEWRDEQVAARLNVDQLRRRPDDAFELAYSITRRAEAVRLDDHAQEAFDGVREARAVLEALPPLPLSFTRDGWLAAAVRGIREGCAQGEQASAEPSREGATALKALYLNYLGKCYRLSCTLALDLGQASEQIEEYLCRALGCLRLASAVMPLMPYPYGHRLQLAHETRLPLAERESILEQVLADLWQVAVQHGEARDLIEGLRAAFPDLPDL